jgi:hypothetical protein
MKSPGTLAVVVALSVATWLVFYLADLPLDAPGTGVVCGFWLALVLLGRWIWSRRAAAKKVGGPS